MPRWSQTDVRLYQMKRNPTSPEKIKGMADTKAEKELHRECVQWLGLKGVRAVVDSRMDKKTSQPRGVPDLLFVLRGVPFAIELKAGNNQPRPEQKLWLEDMAADGWKTYTVRTLAALMAFTMVMAPEPVKP